jgi:hypothetical protein
MNAHPGHAFRASGFEEERCSLSRCRRLPFSDPEQRAPADVRTLAGFSQFSHVTRVSQDSCLGRPARGQLRSEIGRPFSAPGRACNGCINTPARGPGRRGRAVCGEAVDLRARRVDAARFPRAATCQPARRPRAAAQQARHAGAPGREAAQRAVPRHLPPAPALAPGMRAAADRKRRGAGLESAGAASRPRSQLLADAASVELALGRAAASHSCQAAADACRGLRCRPSTSQTRFCCKRCLLRSGRATSRSQSCSSSGPGGRQRSGTCLGAAARARNLLVPVSA